MSSSPTPGGPWVVACLRITDLRPRVDPLTGEVTREPWGVGWPAADAAALEHALAAAEAWDAGVLAVAAGSPAVEPMLAEAGALGASVLRVPVDHPEGAPDGELAADEHEVARRIAAAIAPFGVPSLVVCGDRSCDRGTGALPAFLAHELGAAQALGLVRLEVAPADPGAPAAERTVLAERRLDGGWRERLRVPTPAVCSVEPAGVTLRRAPLAGSLAWAGRPVPVAGAGPRHPDDDRLVQTGPTRPFRPRARDVPAPRGDDPHTRLLSLTGVLDAHDPPTVLGPVGAEEAADALIEFLVRHGYLDTAPPGHRSHPEGTA